MKSSEMSNLPACGVRRHELLQHRFGELGAASAARIRGHVDSCPFCQARLREIEAEEKSFAAANDTGIVSAKVLEQLESAPAPRGLGAFLSARLRPLAVAIAVVVCAIPAAVIL